jgi:hypothetical protein
MPAHRLRQFLRTTVVVSAALLGATGCERSKPPARSDSAAPAANSTAAALPPTTSANRWNALAGPVLLVQGDTRDEAIVLPPAEGDTAAVDSLATLHGHAADVTLFGRGGSHLTGQLAARPHTSNAECRVWPLRGVHGEGTWGVGFVGGQVAPLALDSVDVLSSRDSTALAAEASRLASSVTAATEPAFQGLRFTAHDIRRFEASPGVQALVAHVMRKVNQEANPQEEQTLLIAERDSGATSGPYRLVYAERTHGMEESVVTPEVIAGARIAGVPTLVVARDGEAGVAYVLIERVAPGQWRVRWTSSPTRCG